MSLKQRIRRRKTPAISTNRSQWGEIWHRLKKNKLAMISLAFLILLVLTAIFADKLAPYKYDQIDLFNQFQMPSWEHPFGTDDFGRDIFSRVLYGSRISLTMAAAVVAISMVIAVILGSAAGYFGGWLDTLIMRITDVLMAIPGMLLAITIAAALGTGMVNTAIALTISAVPPLTRIVRSSVMLLRGEEYIEASRLFGASHRRIILKHIVPNTLAPLIVQVTLKFGETILSIAGMSFIGLGIAPPTPEWGSMLAAGRAYIMSFWPIVTFPGIVIALTMLACNLFGDGLRDAMDPRLKQ